MKVRDTSQGRMYAVSSEIGCTAINGIMAVDIPAGGQSVVLALDKKLIIAGDDNAKFVEVRWGTNAAVGSSPAPSWIGDVVDGLTSIVGVDKFDVNYIPAENKLYLIFSLDTTSAQIEEVKSLCARVLPSNVVTEMEWADGLPMTYTRLEYLESTGTQWIDTGIKLSNESEVRCDYSVRRVYEKNCYLLGAGGGTLYTYATETVNTAPNTAIFYAFKAIRNTRWTDVQKFNEKNSLILSNKQCSLNGVTRNLTDSSESFETLDCFVFARNEGAYVLPSSGIVYSFSIFRNSRSQLNCIPTLDPAGKPCMFDLITREPFYNAATTGPDFIVGMTLDQVRSLSLPAGGGQLTLSLPYEASIDKLAQTALEQARANGWELTLQYAEAEVPAGYSKLDFLESTGTQWIDTGVNLSSESVIEGSAALANDRTASIAVWGSYSAADKYSLFWHLAKQEGVDTPIGQFQEVTWFDSTTTAEAGKKYQFKQTRGELWIDGELAKARDIEDFSLDFSAALFCIKQPVEEFYYRSASRIYSFSISRAGEMQVDYVPCITPDGKLGMYNRADGSFHENDGTGAFIAGLATVDDVLNLWLPETNGTITISVPADTPDSAVDQLRTNNPTWQIAIQFRTDNEN